ncbi:MAG: carboxypeptidase-like regulatory domain-containing protein [Thermoplasmata archaeon]|nr:MAG: carboxypeptidase-like regulatory domain-containing protein [Thermoplasmata archaeon]
MIKMEEESKEQKEAVKKREDLESGKPSHSILQPKAIESSQPTQQQPPSPPFATQPPPYPYSPYPPMPPPSPYYYPQQPPGSLYSWELYPHIHRELVKQKPSKNPILTVIGAFLIITFALEFPIAGLMIYYGSSDGVDFGGTMVLEGEITAEDGTNLSGATISIRGTDLSTTSNEQGNFSINNAPRGIWTIEVSLAGYMEEKHKVLLHQDFIESVDFQLEEGSGSKNSNDIWYFFSLAILAILFSPFVFAGAYYAFRRVRFAVVLVGSILGIITMSLAFAFSFIPSIFIMGAMGFLFSSSALVMTVINRKAFIKSRGISSEIQTSQSEK